MHFIWINMVATQEWFLAFLYWKKNYVLQCYPCLTVEDNCVAFQSNSWASLWAMRRPYLTDKPPTRLFCSCGYFYSHFHLHTSHNLTRCAIYSTCKRFCFHYGHNRKLHALSPPSSKKNDVIMLSCCRCHPHITQIERLEYYAELNTLKR